MMNFYTELASRFIFPLHERIKGHSTVALRQALEGSQWWTPQALQELQLNRLRALLRGVSQTVPFYRELFRDLALSPERFEDIADLQHLPVVDKSIIRGEGVRWQAEGARHLVAQHTSGSSGEPLPFQLSRRRISMDIAAKWRATRWWGVDIGDPEIVLWGSPIETGGQGRLQMWRDRFLRSRLIPVRDLSPSRLDAIVTDIRAFRPRMLFGYPSALARLAWHIHDRGLSLADLGIRVAFTTSEILKPEWRISIGQAFGCGIANEYGARDAGFIARECPQGGLHLTAEALIVEILDEADQPVPPGETGNIVITNLMGPEFPFIRYRTGDRGRLDPRPCLCGRGLPLLGEVMGRANDGLVTSDGAWVHGSAFNYLLRDLPGLRAYKIVQEQMDRIEVSLVLDDALPERNAMNLQTGFRRLLGESVRVRLQQVEVIPPEVNGKYRHVVCRIAADGRDTQRNIKSPSIPVA